MRKRGRTVKCSEIRTKLSCRVKLSSVEHGRFFLTFPTLTARNRIALAKLIAFMSFDPSLPSPPGFPESSGICAGSVIRAELIAAIKGNPIAQRNAIQRFGDALRGYAIEVERIIHNGDVISTIATNE